MEVEDVLCYRSRIRILKILMKYGQLNLTDMAVKNHSNFVAARKNLKVLEEESIVQQRRYGRTHFYRLADSPKSKAVQELLVAWEAESNIDDIHKEKQVDANFSLVSVTRIESYRT
jgi:predicted transcriptional regulator